MHSMTPARVPTAVRHTFTYGQHEVSFETGEIARQASGAVRVRMGDTVVLVTAVANRDVRAGADFFPLTVDYQEKYYAGGRIPGGFFKREGRLTEQGTLVSRLIDRPIRPLFPEHFRHEIQVIATVLSLDPEVGGDIPALLGASATLMLAGVPFKGPIGAARVGYIDGRYILNPSQTQLRESDLDLVVAGTNDAVLMVESEAKLLSEDVMLGAVIFGHEASRGAIEAILRLVELAGQRQFAWQAPEPLPVLRQAMQLVLGDRLRKALRLTDKPERKGTIQRLRQEVKSQLAPHAEANHWSDAQINQQFEEFEYEDMRQMVLDEGRRLDGRDLSTVRPISSRVGLLPRTHGSALFTRGETQAIATVTLGTVRDAQVIDTAAGESRDAFLFHYNFPPFCTGETRPMIGPKRREIGHGRLAKRGVQAVLPGVEVFPYTVRVVSEITESNGSSSMASVCGSSLALMDAGVPITAPVAGIAMGLVKEGDRFAVLSDILGDEDHLGDMDFKVAGTAEGISALQMDIKIDGITEQIMRMALSQAKRGRLHILGEMARTIEARRAELSPFAPRLLSFKIPTDKIREVIGKGGATIQALTKETGTQIDIKDDGTITIASSNGEAALAARARIEQITSDVEPGRIYDGRVARLMDFGAFVTIAPGKDGLVHVSQISNERVERVADKLAEGDLVRVKVLEIDRQGRIRLSMKAVEDDVPVEA